MWASAHRGAPAADVHGDGGDLAAVASVRLDEPAAVRVPQPHNFVVAATEAVLAVAWRRRPRARAGGRCARRQYECSCCGCTGEQCVYLSPTLLRPRCCAPFVLKHRVHRAEAIVRRGQSVPCAHKAHSTLHTAPHVSALPHRAPFARCSSFPPIALCRHRRARGVRLKRTTSTAPAWPLSVCRNVVGVPATIAIAAITLRCNVHCDVHCNAYSRRALMHSLQR